MPVLKLHNNPNLIGISSLSAKIIMPSIHKFLLVYIDDRTVILRVLEVQSIVVHTDGYYVMATVVVVLVGTGIVCWFEDLDEDYHWLALKEIAL